MTVTNGVDATVNAADRVRPAGRHHDQQLLGRRRRPQPATTTSRRRRAGPAPLAPGASFSWGYIGTGAYRAPTELHASTACACGGGTPAARRHADDPDADADDHADAHAHADRRPRPRRPGGKKVVGYFAEWGVYGRNYHVKNIHTSGSAAKLTHILYAFGNTTGGRARSVTPTPTTTRRTPRPEASTASPTPGTSRCAATSTSCASSSRCTRT